MRQNNIAAVAAIFVDIVAATAARADGSQGNGGQDGTFGAIMVAAIGVALVVALGSIRSALANSKWSLADALSEEADVTPKDAHNAPLTNSSGDTQIISEMHGSTSRFIALIGLVAILVLYLGFGLVVLKRFADGANPTDTQLTPIMWFLFSGATMFAPYVANKFSSVFDWLKPVKP